MAKKNSEDLDDLLALTDEDTKSPAVEEQPDFDALVETPPSEAPSPDVTPVVEDDMAAEIAALKLALAEPVAAPVVETRPKPEAQLTPQERELRDLKDQMARRQATTLTTAENTYDDTDTTGKDVVLIHIMEDGFTINGEVCYRGREIEFVVGSLAYEQTKNRNGKSWLDMTEDEQLNRWGTVKFGLGKWPFRPLALMTLRDLPEGSTPEDLAAVKRAALKNDRRAPVFAR